MARSSVIFLVLAAVMQMALGFRPLLGANRNSRSLSMLLDGLAELSIASKLATADLRPPSSFADRSFPMALVETKQGMYKEYTVDVKDDSYLDEVKRGYKTADETEDSKGKYWTILAVLLFGSFSIPMVQYWWYVAEED